MATHDQTPNPSAIILRQPKDIIYNIFFRLRVKTLLRLKSVCKSWLSLISSPEFIKTHLSVSTNDPHLSNHGLVIVNRNHMHDLWTCSVYSLLHEPFTASLQNDLHFKTVVGYSNGLILVQDWYKINCQLHVWNPSTKEVRAIPKLDWISSFPDTVYGFCYDTSNDDYKVFSISPAHVYDEGEIDKPTDHYEFEVSVYSLRCDCWRTIEDFPFRITAEEIWKGNFYDGVFANGSINWLLTPEKKINILSFDIKSETCRELLQPKFGNHDARSLRLGTFGKNLSVLCQYENTGADLWIMEECGLDVSWTKLFNIAYDQLITCLSCLNPICMTLNGDVLLLDSNLVLLCNPKEKKIKHLLEDHYFVFPKAYAYVESLISPHL